MTPLTKPQTGSPSVRPDQLTIPTRARSRSSNTGPPESPLQTPKPAVSPSFRGSIRLSCWELGRSGGTSVTAHLAPGLATPLHPDTEARDNEPVADRRRRPAVAERGRREIRRRRRGKLDERQGGGIGPEGGLRGGGGGRRRAP